MKKLLFAAAVLTACLLGCGKERDPEEYVRAENFVVYTSAVYSETEMILYNTDTTPVAENMSYALNGTSVELYIGENIVKTLDYYYTPDTAAISVADFNFDGYDDIFIPYDEPKDYGYYYCYDPVKKTFKEDEELASVGRIMTVGEDNVLIERQKDGYSDRTIEYKWNNGKLKPFRKIEKYKSSEDKKIYTDYYGYKPDGTEYLEKSE